MEQRVRGFIDEHPELFGAAHQDLVLRRESSGNFGRNKQLWFVEFQQHHDGIPVEGAGVFFRINHGNLVQFGSERVGRVEVNTRANVGHEEALAKAVGSWDAK